MASNKQIYHAIKKRLNYIKPNFVLEYRFRHFPSPGYLMFHGFGRARGERIMLVPTHKDMRTYINRISVLVHEYGHYVRWLADPIQMHRTYAAFAQAYEGQFITADDKRDILVEEILAWVHGQALLSDYLPTGDERWREFLALKDRYLDGYREFLDMKEESK